MRNRPIIIPVLRISGVLALIAAAALFLDAIRSEELAGGALVLSGAAAATALFLFGFATNLAILEDIRQHLTGSRER